MLNFLLKKSSLKRTQKFIDALVPKVNIHLNEEIPLPSLKDIKQMAKIVSEINGLEQSIEGFSDSQLQSKTNDFRQKYEEAIQKEKGNLESLRLELTKAAAQDEREELSLKIDEAKKTFDDSKQIFLKSILPEAFAVVRETGKRTLGLRHYDVQMIGGMVLNSGDIAEMTTGEGKTLMSTLPAYLNALTGEGVHVVTVNDYLAGRDRDWMAPLFEFLGLTVGVIQHDIPPPERKQAYNCDITYGTNNEFGFDYLRDNMVNHKEDMVQREHHFAVVDEVDSILIDEARTPLIISGPAEESTDKYYTANTIVPKLKGRRVTEQDMIDAKHKEIDLSVGYDYLADEKTKSISLTDDGEGKAAELFGVDNLHDMETIEYRHHILQSLRAHEFFKHDVDYVVREGEVIIVDEFTGRMMSGRRWSDGLHQAVEAKEGIKIARENQTLATITFQNYFRLYDKLSGMTGTAETEAMEFKEIYKLDVCVIPTNRPMRRENYGDAIYKTVKEKFKAVGNEIEECHKRGQPVLVGTISIERSEALSHLLQQIGVKHEVLNAKHHTREAHIIAQAGRLGAVTIATNMAGRGTDIVLGGNAEHLARQLVEEKSTGETTDSDKEEMVKKFIEQFRQKTKEEHAKVIELGGLRVIGTERHESRRIDNQLRGRQGRQGDPGASRFFVSLEDDLMRLFASDKIMAVMDRLGMEEDQVLEHPWLTRALETAQRRVEGHNFDIRKHLLEYDNVMNKQREVIYSMRRSILESVNVHDLVLSSIEDMGYRAVDEFLMENAEGDRDLEGLKVYLKTKFDFELNQSDDEILALAHEDAGKLVSDALVGAYKTKENDIVPEHLRQLERMLFLHTIDSKWKDHLYTMDQLKEGVGLRSFGQRDPIMEYKREGFHMFQMMYESINEEVATMIFKIQPMEKNQREIKGVFSSLPQKLVHDEASGLSGSPVGRQRASGSQSQQAARPDPVRNNEPKVGRNDPCSCGSGKKYKKCCGQ